MDPLIGASIISAGSNLLGGLFGKSQADKNIAMQKEFAQNGIRWRVADAEKAGIHPLYAMGAQVTPFSPVSVGDGGFAAAGQDLSRAYMATRTEPEKASAYQEASQALTLQNMELQNQLLASQIAKANQPGQVSFPSNNNMIPGQSQSGVVDLPHERVNHTAGVEPGAIADINYADTGAGYLPIPSKDIADRMEDNIVQQINHFVRNNILPNFGNYASARGLPAAPRGKEWVWDRIQQSYVLASKGERRARSAISGAMGPWAPFFR